MLGALSGFIPDGERVLTIEDTPELRLRAAHVERMQTREANTEGEGAVSMRELVALSLRRRPDRIIVGECRGAEAYEMLQAMQTDHPGSMTTVHANDPGNAVEPLAHHGGLRRRRPRPRRHRPADRRVACGAASIVHVERMRDGGPPRHQRRGGRSDCPSGAAIIPRAELFRFDAERRRCVRPPSSERVARVRRPAPAHQRMRAAGVRYDPAWFFGS